MTADMPSRLVPKLRFPEFRHANEWEHGLLKDFVNTIRTGKLNANAMVQNGKYRFYTCAKNYYLINEYAFEGEALLIAGNGAYLGYVNHYVGKFNAYQRTYVLQDFKIEVPFLKFFLDRNLPARIQMEKKDGNTPYIVLESVADMPLLIPPSAAEQQKIADCLDSLDDLIVAEERMLVALKAHKQGLLQQLFPEPGETLPRLRFPEFRDSSEWDAKFLGDLVSIESGKSPSHYALVPEGDCAFVKVEDLNNCTKYQVDARQYCNDAQDAVPSGSILFPKRGAAIENNKIRITASPMLIDTNLMALTPDDIKAEFLYHYLVRVGLAQIADASTIPQINNKHILPFRVLAPSEQEQQKIADCLDSLDNLMVAEGRKLVALKAHKQGLLQQLFPTLEGSE